MNISKNQALYILETLKAIQSGRARVGTKHYTVLITSKEMREAIKSIEDQLSITN